MTTPVRKIVAPHEPEAVVKEAFWLAWQACGGPRGMGVFQDRPDADKEKVWNAVRGATDYSEGAADMMGTNKPGQTYGDYVFGRMMKLSLKWGPDYVEVPDPQYDKPIRDYQSWCGKYKTVNELVEAAVASLNEQSGKKMVKKG